jgi:hypothetical protein
MDKDSVSDLEKVLTGMAFCAVYILVMVVVVMDTIYWRAG